MLPVGFESTISAGERPKTHAIDRAANIVLLLKQRSVYFSDKHTSARKLSVTWSAKTQTQARNQANFYVFRQSSSTWRFRTVGKQWQCFGKRKSSDLQHKIQQVKSGSLLYKHVLLTSNSICNPTTNCWDTTPQDGSSRVQFRVSSLEIFKWPLPYAAFSSRRVHSASNRSEYQGVSLG